jgi:hypothetical protein
MKRADSLLQILLETKNEVSNKCRTSYGVIINSIRSFQHTMPIRPNLLIREMNTWNKSTAGPISPL